MRSARLSPAACTRTRIWPAPGIGVGTVRIVITSGPPAPVKIAALIASEYRSVRSFAFSPLPRFNYGTMQRRRILLAAAIVTAASCSETTGTPGDLGLTLQTVSSEFVFPVDLASPPGDPRLFVAEKGGRIRVVENGNVLAPPFLDISARVSTGSEQGLLGLAFDPSYATNGRFV